MTLSTLLRSIAAFFKPEPPRCICSGSMTHVVHGPCPVHEPANISDETLRAMAEAERKRGKR